MQPLQIALLVGVALILALQVWRMVSVKTGGTAVQLKLPGVSDHFSEVVLLGIIGVGCLVLLWKAVDADKLEGLDVAAFLLILQRVIEAVTARWSARSLDRMGQNLANSPAANPAAGGLPGDPPPGPAET